MKHIFRIYVTILLLTCNCFCRTVDDDDEDKPYEFGFTIENYQHRHEKKDVNGIIQGEFGFITADGIYHVTVYATDENGDFHILSMKNIRVSPPLDQIDAKSKPQTKQSYSSQKGASKNTTPRTRAPFTTQPTIKPACAGCGYVTTPKLPKQQQNTFAFQTPGFQDKNPQKIQYQNLNNLNNGLLPPEQNSYTSKHPDNSVSEKIGNYQNSAKNGNEQFGSVENGNNPQSPTDGSRSPALLDRQNNPLSRVSVSNNKIHVPGNPDIPIVDKYPNMKEGLPPGIEEKDIKDLLYKFNYTVGFHGHYERGYKSGAKIGGYFVNGRDGISRIVTYVADENGFRPKVRFVNLGLDSPLTPHEETEKNFGLKSFEFIWYPIE